MTWNPGDMIFALISAATTVVCIAEIASMLWSGGKWTPTRIEMAADWYLVGIRTDDLQGLRVRM